MFQNYKTSTDWYLTKGTTSKKRKSAVTYIAENRDTVINFGCDAAAFDAMPAATKRRMIVAIRWALKPINVTLLEEKGITAHPGNILSLYKMYGPKPLMSLEERAAHYMKQGNDKGDMLFARYANDFRKVYNIEGLSEMEKFYAFFVEAGDTTQNGLMNDHHSHKKKNGREAALKHFNKYLELKGDVKTAVGENYKDVTPKEAVAKLEEKIMSELIDFFAARLGLKVIDTTEPALDDGEGAAGLESDSEGDASGAPIAEHNASMVEEGDDDQPDGEEVKDEEADGQTAGDQQPIDEEDNDKDNDADPVITGNIPSSAVPPIGSPSQVLDDADDSLGKRSAALLGETLRRSKRGRS